ncbi:MAG TPA: protein-disulfide reductase DsbD, partial [Rhodocyclaceae bacterium]|nr:protein-disulfide reductase DsbD [Rhodocyclaceae bacterium]
RALDEKSVEVRFDIQPGYYLYRDRFRFAATSANLGQPQYPRGEVHQDEFFGKQIVFRNALVFKLPVDAPLNKNFTLTITAQGCADLGVCYPPTPFKADLMLAAMSAAPDSASVNDPLAKLGVHIAAPQMDVPDGSTLAFGSSLATPSTLSSMSSAIVADDSASIAGLLQNASLPWIVLSFFGFGLLLCFTPCVLPMLPILSGIIVGQGAHISRRRAFTLSLSYVFGMAVTYTLAGIAAGLSGTLLAVWLQNVWVLGAFALIFVLLALSMFGVYELQLPAAMQSKLSGVANRQRGSLGGLALMGALSALIVGPCVAAPLAGALLYIAQTRNALLGGIALFAMALGMGVPLLIVGVAARHWLPKAGAWMDGVKRLFGVLLLATAIWLVSPVVPAVVSMLAWAALLVVIGILLRALDALPAQANNGQRVFKGIGVLSLLAGVVLLIGAMSGARDPLHPLSELRAGQTQRVMAAVRFQRVKSIAELEAQLAASGKPAMLDFYADWCVSCKEMERFTFSDPAVRGQLDKLLLLQADVTANSEDDRALLKHFGLFGPPGTIFFNARGEEVKGVRVIGFMGAERFGKILGGVVQQ